ncbi:MAG: MFS transporter, partial [Shewanella sp.]
IGYILLILATPIGIGFTDGGSGTPSFFLYLSLASLVIGTGLFKPNISVMVGRLYDRDDPALDAGYTYFWTGINVGALLASLLAGYVFDRFGAGPVYILVSIALMLCVLITLTAWKNLPDKARIEKVENIGREDSMNMDANRWFLIVLVILCGGIFNTIFQQLNTVITVFADERIDRDLMGFSIPTLWLLSLNQIAIIICVPLVTLWWAKRSRQGKNTSAFVNFSIAFAVMTATFGIMALMSSGTGKVSLAAPAFAIWLTGLAEIFIQPIGLSMASQLAPKRYSGPIMGAWFLAYAFAYYASGQLGVLSTIIGDQNIFILSCAASVAMFLMLAFSRKSLETRLHKAANTKPSI